MTDPILTERLRMRPWEIEDAEAAFGVFADPAVGGWVGGAHETIERTAEMIARNRAHQEQQGFSMWVVEERATGAFVGEAGLQLLQLAGPEVEIGWAFAQSAWGRGYATEAGRAWLELGFTTLGLDQVMATILPDNAPSHRVAQRLGMEREPERRHVYGAEHDIYVIRRDRFAAA